MGGLTHWSSGETVSRFTKDGWIDTKEYATLPFRSEGKVKGLLWLQKRAIEARRKDLINMGLEEVVFETEKFDEGMPGGRKRRDEQCEGK